MTELIDLSQEIYEGMPVYKNLPQVKMAVHNSHEEWEGIENSNTITPAVHKLELGEHTGTHVDAINHMAKAYEGQSIDKMPLSMFYNRAVCLDFSSKGLREMITAEELERALNQTQLEQLEGSTILLHTDHYRKHFNTDNWGNGPGVTVEATRWLGEQKIAAFGVETMSPGVPGISNKEVHHICGELGFTHYENMINLHRLIDRGVFQFIGFPLKIRGGTGSPVRAVAVIESE